MTALATRPRADSSVAPAEVLLPALRAMWATAFVGYRAWAMLNPWALASPQPSGVGAHSTQEGNAQSDPWVMRAHNIASTAARPLGPTRIKHHENGCRGNPRWEPREETDPAWLDSAARCKQCANMKRVRAAEAAS